MSEGSADSDQIGDVEKLARFILFDSWVRKSDNTVKADAFVPFPYRELSVTRHSGLSEDNLWDAGREVAQMRQRPLYGRADLMAKEARTLTFDVLLVPPPIHHVSISGWPEKKNEQKQLALKLSAGKGFIANPRFGEADLEETNEIT